MKKIFLLFLSIVLLWGCSSSKSAEVHLDEKVTISFFYISTCSDCKAFKSEAVPYIENKFGDQVTIQLYDFDDESTTPIYDKIVDSLKDFDQSKYGMGPFISVDGYFAKLGYTSGDEEELTKDIEKAVKHEELGYELEAYRFLYKDSK